MVSLEIPHLKKLHAHYSIHKNLQLTVILSHMDPVQTTFIFFTFCWGFPSKITYIFLVSLECQMSHSLQPHQFYRPDSIWWTAYVIQCLIMKFFWPPNTCPLLDSDVPHSIPFSDIHFNISMVVADKITVFVWVTAPRSGYMFQHSASTALNSFVLITGAVGSFKMSKHGPTTWCSNSK